MWIWNYAFVLSKFAEMGDTIFLILKAPGRDVISGKFLHWYHHVTVLAFTWFAAYNHYSAGASLYPPAQSGPNADKRARLPVPDLQCVRA